MYESSGFPACGKEVSTKLVYDIVYETNCTSTGLLYPLQYRRQAVSTIYEILTALSRSPVFVRRAGIRGYTKLRPWLEPARRYTPSHGPQVSTKFSIVLDLTDCACADSAVGLTNGTSCRIIQTTRTADEGDSEMEPICEHDEHICPACLEDKPCMDLFQDSKCGLVACTSNSRNKSGKVVTRGIRA